MHPRNGEEAQPVFGKGRGQDVFGNVQLRIYQIAEARKIFARHGEMQNLTVCKSFLVFSPLMFLPMPSA